MDPRPNHPKRQISQVEAGCDTIGAFHAVQDSEQRMALDRETPPDHRKADAKIFRRPLYHHASLPELLVPELSIQPCQTEASSLWVGWQVDRWVGGGGG